MSDNQQQRDRLLVDLHAHRHHQRNPLDLTDAARARGVRLRQVLTAISESHVEVVLACISC